MSEGCAMRITEIKYFEGNNIKRHKRIIRIIFNEISTEEAREIAELYIELCERIHTREEIVDLESKGQEVHLWVSYSEEEVADLLWYYIIQNRTMEVELLEKGRQICKKSSVDHLVDAAVKADIPVIRLGKDRYQIGYGKTSEEVDLSNRDRKPGVKEFIENLKTAQRGYIPIFSVTGTNGKTTTARLLYLVLLKLGYCTGVACTGEIKIGSETVEKGDTTGFLSARRVLTDKRVEAAVFETARGGILRNGLGYEKAVAAIITSLSEDHIGIDSIKNVKELIQIKSVILEEISSNGKWILRAQEDIIEEAREIAARRKKEGIEDRSFEQITTLISIDFNEVIQRHMEEGGEAYFLDGKYIVHGTIGKWNKLINVKELAFTYGGLSKGNIINVMCVLAAVSTVEPDVRKALIIIKGIHCDIEQNPGRQNILDFGKVKILIDYGHNPEAYEFIYSIVKGLKPVRVTSIITVAGDRNDIHIETLGYMAGKESSRVIIREQRDQRGSEKGRVASFMEKGVLKSGLDRSEIRFIENAGEALIYALEEAVPGEVVVIFAEELEDVLERLKEYAENRGEKLENFRF
jgi:UDP-N-acetylmuramyl tripeptide synthase